MRCISRAKSAALVCVASISLFTGGCIGGKGATPVTAYELKNYNQDLYQGKLYAEELCVAQNDVALEGYTEDTELHSAALFDLTGERVLYSYKAHERLYPASTTKIMTALLAIENANLDDQVTISGNADASSFPADAQVCGLAKGEVWTLRDLLGALLLYSGNDAATAIAEYVGGSEEAFVNMMNRRAQELMANGTHFMNPHGLHDDNHYTCARDMALIGREIWRYPEFLKICQEQSYKIPASDTTEEHVFPQHHKMLIKENKNYYQYAVAGKTGYTSNALSTLITMADNGNMKLVCVVLRTHGVNIYPDTKNLFEYAFNNFQKIQVADEKKPDEVEKFISAADSQSAVSAQSDESEDTESVQTGGNEYQPLEDGHVILPKDVSYKDIDYEITDVDEDTGEGTIRYIYDGHQVGSATAEFTDKYLQKVSTRKERVDSKPKDVDNSGDSKKNGGKSSVKSIWKNFLQKVKAVWDFGQKKFAGKSTTEKYVIAGGCVALVILIFSLIVLLIRRRR